MSKVEVKQETRLPDLIGFKLRVLIQDNRVYVGELLAFDKFMNLVLKNCVEERIPKTQLHKLQHITDETKNDIKIEKRVLGLAILRGEQVLSTVVEDKPQQSKRERLDGIKRQEKKISKQRRSRNRVSKEKDKIKIERRSFQAPVGLRKRT